MMERWNLLATLRFVHGAVLKGEADEDGYHNVAW